VTVGATGEPDGRLHSVEATFTLELPTGPLADAVLHTVRTSVSASIANHSVRSFFFAQLLAEHEGARHYNRDLLFAATVLHDLGIGDLAYGATRFEVEGADLAAYRARCRRKRCGPSVGGVALHTSPGVAERRGLLAYLTRGGIGIDFGLNAALVAFGRRRSTTRTRGWRWSGR
jgi:hypothetical protein